MNKKLKRGIGAGLVVAMIMSLTACGGRGETIVNIGNGKEDYMLQPSGNYLTEEVYKYTDEGIRKNAESTLASKDGLCRILVYPDYYDVTLDYEKGTPEAVGKAYAQTILEAFPTYEEVMEPYIYENVRLAFSGQSIDYAVLEERMNVLLSSIPEEYRKEIKGFATAISGGEKGFAENGKISFEEAVIVQMIPDALRPTACSALSLWGSKTETGKGIEVLQALVCLEFWT